jgi:MFS family permease
MTALRLLLGLFEGGFFPGIIFLLSTWYVRYVSQKRYAGYHMIGMVASAFSGILASV